MLQYVGFVALVAFAATLTTVTNGQSIEYDILNCSAYNFAPGIHHAYHADCRKFYNCDNNQGGKAVNCPAGVLFNRDTAVCDYDAKCDSWDRQACLNQFQQRDETRVMNFPSLCCKEYYRYECANGGQWTYEYCPQNQQFDPNSRQCSQVYQGDCSQCGTAAVDGNPCNYTHMQYVDQCHWRSTAIGIDTIRWCAMGTEMSREQCQCVRSNNVESCKQTTQQCVENDKSSINFALQRFVVPFSAEPKEKWMQQVGGAVVNAASNAYQFTTTSQYVSVDHFSGNTLGPQFAFRLRFSIQNSNNAGETYILSTGAPNDQACSQGMRVSVSVVGNSIRVRYNSVDRATNQQSSTEISTNNFSFGQVSLSFGTIMDGDGNYRLIGRVRSNNQNVVSLTSNNDPQPIVRFNDRATACPVQFGRFVGTLSDVSYWRCAGPSQLINNLN